MQILVLSDIHANYTALEAVLNDAGKVDAVWCLGDLVGYGPDPNLVIETLRTQPNLICLKGNHDAAVSSAMDTEAFNGDARTSIHWQKMVLTDENMEFLRSLSPMTVQGDVTLAHGSPRDPLWEYVLNTLVARINFEFFDTPLCFVGHSHIQSAYVLDAETHRIRPVIFHAGEVLSLDKGRWLLNPGSVGQPRDRDPRAAYAIFDPQARTWEPRRVSYDVAAVQERIRKLGLPIKHALRLSEGW
uniref:Metallophosphoesterase n=1 Tax=uncultured prokaryote TaxID=198431 RepID=H5SM00_9ZZZZ|nr:metallophosphoesterase [uncultured prokaryote]